MGGGPTYADGQEVGVGNDHGGAPADRDRDRGQEPAGAGGAESLFGQTDRFNLAVAASDGERFLEAVRRLRFDVGVIGWVMPYHDGRAVLEALRGQPESPRIVVYTGDPDPTLPRRAMALGAAAFVSKREPTERLLDAVEAVARGKMVFPFLDVSEIHDDPLDTLSPRERELLSDLGSGRTNAESPQPGGLG